MRRFFSVSNAVFLLPVLLLVGCSTQLIQKPKPVVSHRKGGGYRCVVLNHKADGENAVAWSPLKKTAQSQALMRCRTRSRFPVGCKVHLCRWHSRPPAHPSSLYYTCYINNRQRSGVWSATSHSRFTATSHAFARCRQSSGKPESCYLRSCRVW